MSKRALPWMIGLVVLTFVVGASIAKVALPTTRTVTKIRISPSPSPSPSPVVTIRRIKVPVVPRVCSQMADDVIALSELATDRYNAQADAYNALADGNYVTAEVKTQFVNDELNAAYDRAQRIVATSMAACVSGGSGG